MSQYTLPSTKKRSFSQVAMLMSDMRQRAETSITADFAIVLVLILILLPQALCYLCFLCRAEEMMKNAELIL